MTPTILITRPEPSGAAFAKQLEKVIGPASKIVLSPVLQIEPCGTLPDLSEVRQLVFSSRHGVEAFARHSDRRDIPAYAVGEATAKAGRDIGLSVTACGGDARQMMKRILADALPGPFLHVRGEYTTGNLAQDLTLAGIETYEAVIYRQHAVGLTDQAKECLQQKTPVILPLFSPRSARLALSEGLVKAPLFVAAISENVAQEIPPAIAQDVVVADEPTTIAMLDVVQGLFDAAKRLEGGNTAK